MIPGLSILTMKPMDDRYAYEIMKDPGRAGGRE